LKLKQRRHESRHLRVAPAPRRGRGLKHLGLHAREVALQGSARASARARIETSGMWTGAAAILCSARASARARIETR